MDDKSRDVVAAADAWLTALQAVSAADEQHRRRDEEQVVFDTAEVELAAPVMAWREAGR
jgi:hypothetical protein